MNIFCVPLNEIKTVVRHTNYGIYGPRYWLHNLTNIPNSFIGWYKLTLLIMNTCQTIVTIVLLCGQPVLASITVWQYCTKKI